MRLDADKVEGGQPMTSKGSATMCGLKSSSAVGNEGLAKKGNDTIPHEWSISQMDDRFLKWMIDFSNGWSVYQMDDRFIRWMIESAYIITHHAVTLWGSIPTACCCCGGGGTYVWTQSASAVSSKGLANNVADRFIKWMIDVSNGWSISQMDDRFIKWMIHFSNGWSISQMDDRFIKWMIESAWGLAT